MLDKIASKYYWLEDIAKQLTEEAAYTEGELQAYEDYWNAVSTEKSLWQGKYRLGEEKGRAEGKAEAMLETAKNLLALKVDEVIIIQSTGLSKDELGKLKEQL